ncbi:MAG: T9SS type A sorting domain-containing protein [Bacteroidota bacterium]
MTRALLAFVLLLPALASAQIRGGTYTLGSDSRNDFESFEEVFFALQDRGIDGPVVIEVEQANYTGRLELGRVPGVSSTNTLTFRGTESGGQKPLLSATPSSSEPYVLAIGADWVTFEGFDFEIASSTSVAGSLLFIEADDVSVVSNSFDGNGMPSAVLVDVGANRATIQENSFVDGQTGVRIRADRDRRATSGSRIQDNDFQNQTMVSIRAEDQASTGTALQILGNTTTQLGAPPPTSTIGIWIQDIEGHVQIWRNLTRVRLGTNLRIEDTDGGRDGVSVINHRASTEFTYGRINGIEVVNSGSVRLWNNTLQLVDDPTEAGTAILVDEASSDVQILNNILVNEDPDGLALEVEDGDSITELDVNVYDQVGVPTRFALRWEGRGYTDLGRFQRDTRQERDGIAWPVEFGSGLRLTGRSDGDGRLIGRPLREVPDDFEGDARDRNRPYRGADEAATPLADPPPYMSGTYTIGFGDDYDTFNDAVDDLDLRGMNGPVTFIVTGGLFVEQIELQSIRGGSSLNTVTFVGQIGTPQIRFESPFLTRNYVLQLNRVENVTFRRLAFRSDSEDIADVVDLNGGGGVTFDECVFIAESETRGTLLSVGRGDVNLSSDTGNPRNVRVWNSTFVGGRLGIRVVPVNEPAGGFEVIGNEIRDLNPAATFGVEVGSMADGAVVRGNRVEAPGSSAGFIGIQIGGRNSATRSLLLEGNEVVAEDGTGISWEGGSVSFAAPAAELRLVNNSVRMNGDDPATVGLFVFRTRDLLVAHNSASVAGTDPAGAAAVYSNENGPTSWFGGPANLRNNVFQANAGRALVLDVNSTSSNRIDGNALTSAGTVLAAYRYGSAFDGDCANLACVQAATASTSSPQDLNSIEKTVAFVDAPNGDLRLADVMGGDPEMAGLPFPEVTTDVEGDPRSPTRPYRGADEALPSLDPFTVAGSEGWRLLALPKSGMQLGGSGPGGSRFRAGFLEGIYTAGYIGADRDQRNVRGRANVFLYDEPSGDLVPPERSESVRLGQGLWVYVFQDDDSFTNGTQGTFPKTLNSSGGTPLTSDFEFDLSFTSDARSPGLNLVGNPYDQAVTWDRENWERDGVDEIVWVFDPSYNGGDFRTWSTDGVGDLYDGVIGAGQGFYVQASQPEIRLAVSPDARVGLARSVRSLTSNTGGGATSGKTGARGLVLRLFGAHEGDPRESVVSVAFDAFAALGADGGDARRLSGLSGTDAFRLYALAPAGYDAGGHVFAITSLPEDVTRSVEVPLHAEALASGEAADALATLAWDAAALPTGWTVTLNDRQTGQAHDLTEAGQVVLRLGAQDALTVTAADRVESAKTRDPLAPPPVPQARPLQVAAHKTQSTRFTLVLTPEVFAGQDAATFSVSETIPNPTRGTARLGVTLAEAGTVSVRVFDALGREVVSSRTESPAGAQDLSLPVAGLAPGAYVVRVEAPGGTATRRLTVVR